VQSLLLTFFSVCVVFSQSLGMFAEESKGKTLMPAVTIYTTSLCAYCHAALDLLRTKGVAFTQVDVSGDPTARAVLAEKAGGRTSVPQIFVGATHIGGCDDLYASDRSGTLDVLLAADTARQA
jgi:glutaredoxin 3